MAQTNYTPISLYYSTTASAVPTAANLVPGELAINTNDGKLYYEDSSGVVQVLATKSTGSIGGSNTQVQFNNSGSLGGSSSFTWDGTTVTATKFAGALNGTVGATTASTGAFTTLSTSSTTTLSGLTASTALALDASKNVVSVTNTGTGNNVLSASPTLTGTIAGASLSLSSLTSGRVTYATTGGLLTDSSNMTFNGSLLNVTGNINSTNTCTLARTDGQLLVVGDQTSGVAKLDVQTASGTASSLRLYQQSVSNFTISVPASTDALTFTSYAGERMRISSAGYLGIGTSSPSYQLHVSNNQNAVTQIGLTNNTGGVNSQMNFNTTDGTNFGQFGMWGSGVTSSGAQLASSAYVYGSSNVTYFTGGVHRWCINTNTEAMRIDSSGNLLVGTTSVSTTNPGCFIAPNGSRQTGNSAGPSGWTFDVFQRSGTTIGSITQNGTTGVLYNLTSDYRLKNNPTALTGASEFIMALQPKTWDWWDGSGKGVGFIAHEFMEVAKYSGNGTKDEVDKEGKPKYQSIQPSSSEVMANLVALVQELKQEVDSLKQQLASR